MSSWSNVERRQRCGRSVWLPVFLIGLGAAFLLAEAAGYPPSRVWEFFWPLVLVFFGARMLARRRALGLVLIALGVMIGLQNSGYVHVSDQVAWPVVLIAAGVALLYRPRRPLLAGAGPWTPAPATDGDVLDVTAVFGGSKQRITSQNFQGGQVLAMFGGFQLDLSGANFPGDTCIVEANSFFGGGEIIVPSTWQVNLEGQAFLGGFGDETRQLAPTDAAKIKRLIIRGTAIIGGVNIKN